MKTSAKFYAGALAMLFCLPMGTNAQYVQNKAIENHFIIGASGDPILAGDKGQTDDMASFIKAKEMGINLLLGENYYRLTNKESDFNQYMVIAKKLGLYFLAIDLRANPRQKKPPLADLQQQMRSWTYTQDLNADKSNLIGFNLADEVPPGSAGLYRDWANTYHAIYPNAIAYYVMLPEYGFKSREEYTDYLNSYIGDNIPPKQQPDVLVTDFYPFPNEDGTLRADYFWNLDLLHKMAGPRPFWCYLLTTKHWSYPEPDAYSLSFAAFSSIIYGARGLLYFTYETLPPGWAPGITFGPALLDLNHQPTDKYYIAQSINKFVKAIVEPIVIGGVDKTVVHLQKNSDQDIREEYKFKNNKALIQSYSGGEGIVGLFTKGPNTYLFVQNTEKDNENLTLNLGGPWQAYSLSIGYTDINKNSNLWRPLATPSKSITIPLAPGEMKVVQIVQ